ncbi:hypothetical protein RYH80_14635 [Halobaculum sp. MBLA0147]|uniref:hypothetical protein n=1 Tax=Halobaculum sp. MBLA0147 TaxID=3079934 RepID=UPI003523AA93
MTTRERRPGPEDAHTATVTRSERTSGGSLVVGYLLVFVVLFRRPTVGLAAATASVPSTLYFLVIPTFGVIGGVYSYYGGVYGAVGAFVFGSYLGLFGLALTLGVGLSPEPVWSLVGVGVLLSCLSVVTLVGSVVRGVAPVGAVVGSAVDEERR